MYICTYVFTDICVCIYIYIYVPSRLGLQNTPTVSLQRVKNPLTCVLHMIRDNLRVRLQ